MEGSKVWGCCLGGNLQLEHSHPFSPGILAERYLFLSVPASLGWGLSRGGWWGLRVRGRLPCRFLGQGRDRGSMGVGSLWMSLCV